MAPPARPFVDLSLDRQDVCLSVRQPWAWLIAHGWKNVENRDWATKVRGPVLIHAAKGMTRTEWFACTLFIRGFAPSLIKLMPAPEELERGGIVGRATILNCVTHHTSEWFQGPYGFVLDDAQPLPFVPCKGRLGFWTRTRMEPEATCR